MKSVLVKRARELGFDSCRVTTASPPESAPRFEQWLNTGMHGAMDYLARNREKRCNPSQVLANARSIVCLVTSYASPGGGSSAGPASPSQGYVAAYARYRDYHKVIGAKLKTLGAFLDESGGPGSHSLWYVDTGPLLERDLAQRAGLGFIGKHTNLISRSLGNWLVLSEIITTVELEPDAPEHNHCGSCTRCITACPTAAIRAPFELDARRCLSYLTIEWRGPIPLEFRPALGNRVFGCDDCLAVCPWNRFAREGRLMREHRREELGHLKLRDLLELDEASFLRLFGGTPLQRSKQRGLLRNACVALGNTGSPEDLPALCQAAENADPLIAEHARWAIEQIEVRRRESEGG